MRTVFADTVYWGAAFHPGDPYHAEAKRLRLELVHDRIVTTDEVLTEFLDGLARRGAYFRKLAVEVIDALLVDHNVAVYAQSRESFLAALILYRRRTDKQYSLVDCSSMMTMRKLGITEILSTDHHFAQEGFHILMH